MLSFEPIKRKIVEGIVEGYCGNMERMRMRREGI